MEMEASTVRGRLHQEEATFVSKSMNLGHNSRVVEHTVTEASTVPGGRNNKRVLELHLPQEDEEDDDEYWEEKEATFVAGVDGAYNISEMPKRFNLGYNVGESSARIRALDADDERDTALRGRLKSLAAAMMRDMYARAKAKAAAAPAHIGQNQLQLSQMKQ